VREFCFVALLFMRRIPSTLLASATLPAFLFAQSEASVPVPAAVASETELMRLVVDHGTHRVTYIRITPPQIPRMPPAPTVPVIAPTAEDSAEQERQAAKPFADLSVYGTVYAGTPTVTELTWWEDDRRFRAWSNIDFRLLMLPSTFETAGRIFSWMPYISDGSVQEIPVESRPDGLSIFTQSQTAPEYFFEGTEEDMAKATITLAGLDYLHAYYQMHRPRLAEAHARREAEAAVEQARQAAERAAPPKDEDIYFWKIQ
jgi:hypothetical protein